MEELIVKKSGTRYHYTPTYTVYFGNGDSSRRRYQERYMSILHLYRRAREIQKKTEQILVDKQQKQQEKQSQETSFTIVSLDESFFFYDSLVRRVWIEENKRPIVRITGSHKHSCIFGAISIEGKNNYSDNMMYSTVIHSLTL